MRALRTILVALVAAAALSLAVTLAVAAPGAVAPDHSAAAGVYCPADEFESREQAVDRLKARVASTTKANQRFRSAQLKVRKAYLQQLKRNPGVTAKKRTQLYNAFVKKQDDAYNARVRSLNALRTQLARAEAALGRCD
jgi:hypothetical protein